MHEYSLVSSLIERVQREATTHGATKVHRLQVRIGEISGVEIELLRTAYEMCREKTVCAGATLEVTFEEARWACPRCDATLARGARLVCAACGEAARLVAGDAIVLDRIEMEVP
jgi:hydrogenase nickel insertion protein HypA